MLFARLDRIGLQMTDSPAMKKGLEFLKGCVNGTEKEALAILHSLGPGESRRFSVDGERICAVLTRYMTVPAEEKLMEAHREYVDFQIVLSSSETILWADAADCKPVDNYSAERDIQFFAVPQEHQKVILTPGFVAVFFPEDAHGPGIMSISPEVANKICLKIAVDEIR
ncbi:MAG: YhcH/YjgK/YiaL family protein [Firmicutes bacterium]|nr:YhcH/YjgK/YiaL family protein [Bacillota bacterium]